MKTPFQRRCSREIRAVREEIESSQKSLDYAYRFVGRLYGRLQDDPNARGFFRAMVKVREEREYHIESLHRVLRKIK